MEHWITTKFDPNYEVSNLGNVRKKGSKKILKPQLNREGGYYRVTLTDGKREYVHRLVADTFFDGDHTGLDVNHIDGDHSNNNLPNLEWCTRKENTHHAFENGLRYPVKKNVVRCRFCKRRYDYEICDGKDDGFYCGYGER